MEDDEEKPHYLQGRREPLEQRAKIATSMRIKRHLHPTLWDRLFKANLEIMKINEELQQAS